MTAGCSCSSAASGARSVEDGLYGLPAGDRAAQVVCRQLGRAGGTVLPHTALGYHPGPPDVLFDRLVCTGAENRLGDCSFRRSTNIPCDHSEDFAVSCSGETTPPVVNRPPTGLPTTTGAARVGQTLTVDTSGISDPDGPENLVFTYQCVGGWGCDPECHGNDVHGDDE